MRVSVTAAGGLLAGFHLPLFGKAIPDVPWPSPGDQINAWISIDPDDRITIRVAQSEMGQGVMTALPMIVAEELEANWDNVRAEYAPLGEAGGPAYGRRQTAESGAVQFGRESLQRAGAEVRERLIKAAAERWSVSPEACYADFGRVYRKQSRDSLGYGELAAEAAALNVANVRIKSPNDFNLLGLPAARLDVASKVDGSAQFSIDVRLPDMVYAAVRHCPVSGGTVQSVRFNAIRSMPGVIRAVRMPGAVAVVAEHFWQAKRAADELPVFWNDGDLTKGSSQRFRSDFVSALEQPGTVISKRGNIVAAMDQAERSIESDYVAPYLSHACLEPMNCTAQIKDGHLELWVGTQDPQAAIAAAAAAAGLKASDVTLHNCYLGGGFGRRRSTDFITEAVLIAAEVGLPVQMIWTREEDQRAGYYRPMSAARFKAGFDLGKRLIAYTNHSITHSIASDHDPDASGIDPTSLEGLTEIDFPVDHLQISHTARRTSLTVGYWRSRGFSQNVWARECFIDEMAVAAAQDPLIYRKSLFRRQPRVVRVLDVLAEAAGWRRDLPVGTAKGIAINECFGTICGQVAEVTVSPNGRLSVDRIVSVIDCGHLVNPSDAEMQVEGGIVFGLTAALYGKLTVEKGRVLEDNFDTYRVLRMAEMPTIETHFELSRGDQWGGLGEPSVPTVAPAVCNALFKITGRRIRALPISDYMLVRK